MFFSFLLITLTILAETIVLLIVRTNLPGCCFLILLSGRIAAANAQPA